MNSGRVVSRLSGRRADVSAGNEGRAVTMAVVRCRNWPVRRFYGPAKRRSKLTRGGLDAFRHGQQKQQQERYQRARNPPRQRRRQYRVAASAQPGEAPSDPAGVIGEGQRVESQHGAAHGERRPRERIRAGPASTREWPNKPG